LVKGLGKIAISPDHSISNVFLVDSLDYNLLSVSQLCKMGYNSLFTDIGVTVCWGPSSSEGPQKHNLTMSSKYDLWTGIFGFMLKAHTMRSLIVTKVVVAPKLYERKLWLNHRKGNRLKREKVVQSS
jgi:hypothetical protein